MFNRLRLVDPLLRRAGLFSSLAKGQPRLLLDELEDDEEDDDEEDDEEDEDDEEVGEEDEEELEVEGLNTQSAARYDLSARLIDSRPGYHWVS